jgi:hypothetical protein
VYRAVALGEGGPVLFLQRRITYKDQGIDLHVLHVTRVKQCHELVSNDVENVCGREGVGRNSPP